MTLASPTLIKQSSADAREGARAKWWRKNTMQLKISALSEMTGVGHDTIIYFERGYGRQGLPLPAHTRKRYRLVCAAVSAGLQDFKWGVDDV